MLCAIALATAPGQRFALSVATRALSETNLIIRTTALDGSLFSDGKLDQLTIADVEGVWLKLENISYSWQPSSLLTGKVDIADLTIGRAVVLRRPLPDGKPLNLPRHIIPLELNSARVIELYLDTPVLGTPAKLTASASLINSEKSNGLSATINATRTDGHAGNLNATLVFAPAQKSLAAAINLTEPANGIVAKLLDLPDQPAIDIALDSSGTLDDWQAKLSINAGPDGTARGDVRILRQHDARQFTLKSTGRIAALVPPRFRDLLAGETHAFISGKWSDDGHLHLARGEIQTDAARVYAQGVADLKRRFMHGSATMTIGRTDRTDVTVPLSRDILLKTQAAELQIELAPQTENRPIKLSIRANGLQGSDGVISHADLQAAAIQPTPYDDKWQTFKDLTIQFNGDGIAPSDPSLAPLLTPAVSLTVHGAGNATSLILDRITATTPALELTGTAALKNRKLTASADTTVKDIAPFSTILQHSVAGQLVLHMDATADTSAAGGSLRINGTLQDGTIGKSALDALLAGTTKFSAGLTLGTDGKITIEKAIVDGTALSARADGHHGQNQSQANIQIRLSDLSRLDPKLTGAAVLQGEMAVAHRKLSGNLELSSDGARWQGTAIAAANIRAALDGTLDLPSASVTARLDDGGHKADAAVSIALEPNNAVRIAKLDANYGRNRIYGDLLLQSDGRADGVITADLPNVQQFNSLLNWARSGRLSMRLAASSAGTDSTLEVTGSGSSLGLGPLSIERTTLTGKLTGSVFEPRGKVRLLASKLRVNDQLIDDASVTFERTGEPVAFDILARSSTSTLTAHGNVLASSATTDITINDALASAPGTKAALISPARLTLRDGQVAINALALSLNDGRIDIKGSAGSTLDVDATLTRLPARIANLAATDLDLRGDIGGRIKVTGTASTPQVSYDLAWVAAGSEKSTRAGLPAVDINARGTWQSDVLQTDGRITSADGMSLAMAGTVDHNRTEALQIRANGTIPVKMLAALAAERGVNGSGQIQLDVSASGQLAAPRLQGTIAMAGGTLADPATGTTLTGVTLAARLDNNALEIDRLTAQAPAGGNITIGGRVLLDAKQGFPANLNIDATTMNFDDKRSVAGQLDGRATISGPLATAPFVKGGITLARVDITIPEQLPRTLTDLDIRHTGLSTDQRKKLGLAQPGERQGPDLAVGLDLRVISGGRIFVRGRGIDAELSGDLLLGGTSASPSANGSFKMERGRIAILGRRLEFSRGTIGFSGQLDPALDFEATSEVDGVTLKVTVTGPASDPKLKFTSSPELPEDEILARLLFNKALSKLSPVQVAQLALEVDRLGGLSSGPGILDQLRKSAGVDVLDVTTDSKGNAAVSAGGYIGDNVYVGVQQNLGTNTNKVVIDLDITKHIKARGETTSDGSSKLGIGVEWNY